MESLGGAAKVLALKNRTMRGEFLRMRVDDPGTPRATAVNRGTSLPLEIDFELPGKFLMQFQSPGGPIRQFSDGTSAWVVTPQEKRAMRAAEIARVREVYDPHAPLRLREQAATITTEGKEFIGQSEAYVLISRTADGRLQRYFFAMGSGLLLRRVAYTQLLLGLDPEQFDFEDYRDVSGVLVPFTIKVSYLDDNHLGNTRRFTEVKNNVRSDPSRFSAPSP